jgi:hypothetical protein
MCKDTNNSHCYLPRLIDRNHENLPVAILRPENWIRDHLTTNQEYIDIRARYAAGPDEQTNKVQEITFSLLFMHELHVYCRTLGKEHKVLKHSDGEQLELG